MHQQPHSSGVSPMTRQPGTVDAIELWLEDIDEEESKRIGRLKEEQKQKQKEFEERYKKPQKVTQEHLKA